MRKTVLFLAALLSLCFFSCKYSEQYQTINADNLFSISIPSWMKEDKALKEGAPFQYANHFRNFYSIGEVVPKSNATTAEVMSNNLHVLRKSLKGAVVTDSVDINTDNLKGTRVEIYGKMSNENIYFTEVLFEGQKNTYHISIWTRSEDRKLHFKTDIDKIIASVKEIWVAAGHWIVIELSFFS